MAICTVTEVWDFMGTDSAIRTTQNTMMTNLITREQAIIEKKLGRKLESQTLTNKYLNLGIDCEIFGNELYLINELRDVYSITALTEEGETLEESTAYDDDKDWVLDKKLGIIKKVAGSWSTVTNAIKISGKYGLVDQSDDSVDEGIKQLCIEWIAAKSGYWKYNGEANGENFTTVVTQVSKKVYDALMAYKEVVFIG